MKKNILRIVLILGIVDGLGYAIMISRQNKVQLISIRDQQFKTEIVDTPSKMALGLGERDVLCEQCAMLFVFPEKKIYPFWMKGMRFPLDIIWWDSGDGRIVHIEKKIAPDSQAILTPGGEADRVLEINAGLSDKYSIQEGDKIYIYEK